MIIISLQLQVYLLHLATEYVAATKDVGFLSELVPSYGVHPAQRTVLEGLLQAANFTMKVHRC